MITLFMALGVILFAVLITPVVLESPLVVVGIACGIFFIVLALTNFELGLIILLFVIPFSRQVSVAKSEGGAPVDFGTDDFFICCLIVIWLVYLTKTKKTPFVSSPLTWPFLTYLVVCLLSFIPLLVGGKANPVISILHLAKWYEYVLIYFVLVRYIENRSQVLKFTVLALVSCAIVAAIQMVQIALGYMSGRTFGFAKWATSSFESNGILGAFYVFFLAIAVSLLFRIRVAKIRILLGVFTVLVMFSLYYTFARAAYLGMLVSLMLLGFFYRRKALFLGVLMLSLIPIFVSRAVSQRIKMTVQINAEGLQQSGYSPYGIFASPYAQRKMVITLDQSSLERLYSWAEARELIYYNPVLGSGYWGGRYLGAFGFSTAHNFYLTVLIDTGILGLLAFLWLAWRLLWGPVMFSEKTRDVFYQALTKGFAAGFGGILVHCFFGETFEAYRLTGPLWMMAGVVFAAMRIDQSQSLPSEMAKS